jgi:hypothetical protein
MIHNSVTERQETLVVVVVVCFFFPLEENKIQRHLLKAINIIFSPVIILSENRA